MMFSKLVASEVSEGNALRPRLVSVKEFVQTLNELNYPFRYIDLFCDGVLQLEIAHTSP